LSQYSEFLILGWDGRSLLWSNGAAGRTEQAGEVEATDPASLNAACLNLKASGLGKEVVVFHRRHAFFTAAPASVAEGHEEQLLRLHLGPQEGAYSNQVFHSEAFGDDMVLMERWESEAVQRDVQRVWPHARFESSTLRWLEKIGADSRVGEGPMIAVDIGLTRALLARLEEGQLKWAIVTEDLEGDGLLYHVVNAMHQDGLEPAASGAQIMLSGEVERGDAWHSVFNQFFSQVKIVQPEMKEVGMKTQRLALHSNIIKCA
tara:strand:- start:34 stop:816 length:783 start_codon:yes stop_codon:yes gene_type:complete